MWWESLTYLDALCRSNTMSEAARRLGVNKATVSRHVAELERAAPAPLFERRLGRVELTSYGTRALDAFRDHDSSRMRLLAELEQLEDATHGGVLLTAPGFFAHRLIVPALPAFLARHPQLDLHVHATSRLLDVARGEADIALRSVRPTEGGLDVRKVGRMRMLMFASREYLARRGGLHGPRDLRGHALLCCDTGPYAGPGFEWLPDAARHARLPFVSGDMSSLHDATLAGVGLCVMPAFIGEGTAELVPVEGVAQGYADVWSITRQEQRRVSRVRAVAALVAEVVSANQFRL
ncbi:MAG: LysR family transcriptional regulator [Polyangiales bacterium]